MAGKAGGFARGTAIQKGKMVQTEQEAFVVVVAFPEQMSTDVLSHGRKLLQTWRRFFYNGQGSEGFWLIKGSSSHSPSLRRGSIKEEMQPKQTDGSIRWGMLSRADSQVARAPGNHTKPLSGAKTQQRVLEPWETACALPQGHRIGIVTDPKVRSLHGAGGTQQASNPGHQRGLRKMEPGMKGEVSKVSINSEPVECLED